MVYDGAFVVGRAENRHLQLMNKYVEDCGNIQNV